MAVELLGTRIISPLYGTTSIVWASVIGATLSSLTLGYFIGGKLSKFKKVSDDLLLFLLGISAISFGLLPSISPSVLLWTIDLGMQLGLIYAPLIILGIPLIALGATTPIIIKKLNE